MNRYDLKLPGKYNFKNQSERLIYLGYNFSGNGHWNQFALVEDPEVVWCELLDSDLSMIEETVEEPVSEKSDDASELTDLRALYVAATRLRDTSPVDNDFPEMMHNFDGALSSASKSINTNDMQSVTQLCQRQFDWVERMGWHNKSVLEALALIASEVGEASDELDPNDPMQTKIAGITRTIAKAVNCCRHTEPTENFKVELADICLRIFDLAHSQNIDLLAEILAKMKSNDSRGTRGRRI
jgi:NTP pyrophosphatase (non-canonical NTP hydrolase)